MPALVAGIHVLKANKVKDVDGRDKPGHDGGVSRDQEPSVQNLHADTFRFAVPLNNCRAARHSGGAP
jgi:hypothetical protein